MTMCKTKNITTHPKRRRRRRNAINTISGINSTTRNISTALTCDSTSRDDTSTDSSMGRSIAMSCSSSRSSSCKGITTTTTTTVKTTSSTTSRKQTLTLLLFGLPLLLMVQMTLVEACPSEVCVCKWKGGKQTVECGSQQLPTIPEGMDPNTQVLNFSGNSLQVLQSERFLRMDLLNLQKIYLSRNQLIRIHEKAFRGLSNLVELDLSDNALQHVPSETFQDYSSLMRLSLSGNPIRELKTSAFRHLSFLTTLELSNCQIERIENEAFVGMDNLEWLRLDGNRIGFIQGGHILPKSLHGISLQSNRWTCDCRLLDMHAWLINYNTPQSEEPKCVEPPRLKGETIKSLKKDELACLPEVSPSSTYTEISEGRNFSIVCVVRAIPEPRVLWLFNGQVLTNDSDTEQKMAINTDQNGSEEEKRSEIFIYNVGAEDNGTFSCVGQNIAGTTFSNYTLRVIIKEPPVVNEVSFPRDYMNYIIASSTGAGVIFVVLLCTIVVKCKQQRKPNKRKKCSSATGGVISVTGSTASGDSGNGDGGLMKCSSIINDGESLNCGAGLHIGESVTPTKLALGKENGLLIGAQMKQNLLLYAPTTQIGGGGSQQQQGKSYQPGSAMHDGGMGEAVQLNVNLVGNGTPPSSLLVGSGGGGLVYCSPPASLRNYQEKNPDLVNDAESVKHKLKSSNTGSLDAGDYDAASDCSGPCSIQGMPPTLAYDNCYQLTPQFGTLGPMRPNMANGGGGGGGLSAAASRFAAMTTLPRGMQLKAVMNSVAPPQQQQPQHAVDVHLNPVCFLGQDGFAYDYSNAHLQQAVPPAAVAAHHHQMTLQGQHSLGSAASTPTQQQPQQQSFYRTLPHNRAHKQQQFAASAANGSMRYSLEAEFLQRAATPPYESKYVPTVRFASDACYAAGQQQPPQIIQYPSPPEGYKSNSLDGGVVSMPPPFQQWPACLPGYHAQQQQPIRYVLASPAQLQSPPPPGMLQQPHPTAHLTSNSQTQTMNINNNSSSNNNNNNNNTSLSNNNSSSGSGSGSSDLKKCCVPGAQSENATIPECDENEEALPTTSNSMAATAAVATTSAAATAGAASAGGSHEGEASTSAAGGGGADGEKLRHLNGPLADSPDEGYVGDTHDGSDI